MVMALTQRLFASRSLLTPVVLYGEGSGMEPSVLIVVVDGGVGGLCQQWLLSMEGAVGGADGADCCH